jgi:hypothetical protein
VQTEIDQVLVELAALVVFVQQQVAVAEMEVQDLGQVDKVVTVQVEMFLTCQAVAVTVITAVRGKAVAANLFGIEPVERITTEQVREILI